MHEPLIPHPPPKDYTWANSLSTLANLYERSIDWLGNFLHISSKSRLFRYRSILDQLKNLSDSRDITLHLQNEDFRATFCEAHEIIEACLSLQAVSESVQVPKETLRKLRTNKYLSYREARESGEQDNSRPTFFELYVGAQLIQMGLPIGFTINDEDLFTSFEGHKVYIECKRVTSPRKFYERINEGNKQLAKRYVKGRTKEFGLVFISISDLINPNFDTFTSPTMGCVFNDSHALVNPYLDRVFEMIRRYDWPDKKTVAYFVHAAFPYVVTDGPKAVYRRMTSFSSYFHAAGFIPQLGYAPKVRLGYFDEFERFRKKLSGET